MSFEYKIKCIDNYYKQCEIDHIIVNDYGYFEQLLDNELILSKNAQDNVEVFFNNFDIVMKYTSVLSCKWITYAIIYRSNRFLDVLTENLDKIQNMDDIDYILLSINRFYKVCCKKSIGIFNNRLLYKYLNMCLERDDESYVKLYDGLSDSEKWNFLNLVLSENIPVDLSKIKFDLEKREFIRNNAFEFSYFLPNLIWLRDVVANCVNFDKFNGDYELLPQQTKEKLGQLDDYLYDCPGLLVDSIMRSDVFSRCNQSMKELISLIIADVVKNRKAVLSDIRWLNNGGDSFVLAIKDKVIKFGVDRKTPNFPDNSFIIRPLLRKKVTLDGQTAFIEVLERAIYKRVSREELYELYRNMRDNGLIFSDLHMDNVAVLAEDNIIHWNGNLNPCFKALGMSDFVGRKFTLKKGQLVNIDNDYIYDEKTIPADVYDIIKTTAFEKKYLREKSWIYKLFGNKNKK